jgi:hypothetical protein
MEVVKVINELKVIVDKIESHDSSAEGITYDDVVNLKSALDLRVSMYKEPKDSLLGCSIETFNNLQNMDKKVMRLHERDKEMLEILNGSDLTKTWNIVAGAVYQIYKEYKYEVA